VAAPRAAARAGQLISEPRRRAAVRRQDGIHSLVHLVAHKLLADGVDGAGVALGVLVIDIHFYAVFRPFGLQPGFDGRADLVQRSVLHQLDQPDVDFFQRSPGNGTGTGRGGRSRDRTGGGRTAAGGERAKRENGGQGKCCKLLHFHGQKPLSKFSLSGADASPGIRADKASFHHRHRSRWVCFESRFGFFFIGNPSCAGPAQIKKRLPLLFTRTGAETAPAVPP